MCRPLWIAIVVLIVLHQDNWFWDDGTLVFGFLPIGLFYHAGISLAAATTWYLATQFCWPTNLVGETAEGASAPEGGRG